MESIQECIEEYKQQLKKGQIRRAYKAIIEYMMDLRTHFQRTYPKYFVSGSIYCGYMDMSYFAIIPQSLKVRKLKIAIVFLHDACRFEVWLAAANKKIQEQYWKLFQERKWTKYHIVPTIKGADSILEHCVTNELDFTDSKALARRIEEVTCRFIADVENFLSQPNGR